MKKSSVFKGLAATIFVSSPTLVLADDMFTPPEGDLFMGMLAQIIGTLLQYAGWTGRTGGTFLGVVGDPLHVLLEIISMLGISAALGWVFFSLTSTLLNSSSNGQTLIKDLGGPFYILRVVVVLFLLFPLFKGLGFGMVLLTYLFTKSIGIAGVEWKGFLGLQEGLTTQAESLNGNINGLYAIKMPNPQVHELTYKVFEGYTCMYGVASEQLFANDAITRAALDNKSHQLAGVGQTAQKVAANTAAANATVGLLVGKEIEEGNVVGSSTISTGQDINTESAQAQSNRLADFSRQSILNQVLADASIRNAVEARKTEVGAVSPNNYQGQLQDAGSNTQQLDDAYLALLQGKHKGTQHTVNNALADLTAVSGKTIKENNNVLSFGYVPPNGDATQAACGIVDFNQHATIGIKAQADAQTIQRQLGSYFTNGGGNADSKSKDVFVGAAENVIQKREARRLKGIDAASSKSILEAYVKLFDTKYRAKLQDLAKRYVYLVNTNVRTDWVVDGQKLRAPNQQDHEKLERLRQGLRGAFAAELDKIAHELEREVLNAAVAELKAQTNTDIGNTENYMNVLLLAQQSAEDEGFMSAFKFMTALQNSVANMQTLTRILPYYGNTAAETPADTFEVLGAPSVKKGLSGKTIKQNLQTYYGFMPEFAQFSSSPALYSKYTEAGRATDNPLMSLAYGADVRNIGETYRHPFVLAVESGHTMMDAIQEYTDRKDAKSSTHTANSMAINALVGSLYAMGMMLAFFLPAMPLLYGIGAALGIVVNFLVILFALPVVLSLHLTPEGSKYAGKAAAAYPHITSMLLSTPSLMFGYVVAMIMIQVFGILAISLFSEGMGLLSSSNYSPITSGTSSTTGGLNIGNLTASFAAFLLFTFMLYQLIIKSLATSTMVADKLPTLIGGAMGALADYAQEVGGKILESKLEQRSSAAGSSVSAYQNPTAQTTPVSGTTAPAPITGGTTMVQQQNHTGIPPVAGGSTTVVGGAASTPLVMGSPTVQNQQHVSTGGVAGGGSSNVVINDAVTRHHYDVAQGNALKVAEASGYSDPAQAAQVSHEIAQVTHQNQQAVQGLSIAASNGDSYRAEIDNTLNTRSPDAFAQVAAAQQQAVPLQSDAEIAAKARNQVIG